VCSFRLVISLLVNIILAYDQININNFLKNHLEISIYF
jgi:hypothetical protein